MARQCLYRRSHSRRVGAGPDETSIGIEPSPFVPEFARYRLLPSACNQIPPGNLYHASAAQLVGYVDEVVASPDLLARSIEAANHLASFDLSSYRRTKKAMRSNTTSALRSVLERQRSE
jgi:enoyl-CoA hydratase/carnithine racemase